ncbi:uncharacterized protein LOC114533060 [Dendronephthya gigantea]|uniref:uncharacterized protein LOC114533060 n=1 Tax=Dendronephthya gigantea TaxID=151771 RepID=UPI00106C0727|nr:uncharacterized protein LOC114533060 [Dendronephthya gigantea]
MEAERFSFSLRSPRGTTPEKQAKLLNIKRSDSEKGLERVARKVAKSQNVSWCEHWKFLDGFTDLSTSDGLVKLEEYLKTKAHRLNLEKTVPVETRVPIESSSFCSPCGSISDDVFERSDGTPLSCISSRNKNSNLKNFRGRLKLEESLEDRGTEPIIKHDASQKTCEKNLQH